MTLVAIALWSATGYFVWFTMQEITDHATKIAQVNSMTAEQADTAHMHAIAVSTAPDRAKLAATFQSDLISVVNLIESTGASAHTKTVVTGAAAEGDPTPIDPQHPVHATAFTVQSDGTFTSVMRAALYFQTLPLPSSIEQMDIARSAQTSQTDTSGQWHMNLRLRILTTSNLSS
jgi:hypothetical protein